MQTDFAELLNSDNAFTQPVKFYIIDFLNIFSDYREIIYKKNNIDFHSVKHDNKKIDTLNFFEMFFTRYIQTMHISKNSEFMFILKKLSNYNLILNEILEKYSQYKIRFIIIENEFANQLLDKNKDDFLCQYIFFRIFKNYNNCILISNDKYRDKLSYIKLFQNHSLQLQIKTNNTTESNKILLLMNESIMHLMQEKDCIRCTIPKKQLNKVIE